MFESASEKERWAFWELLAGQPSVCPALAHSVIFFPDPDDLDPRVDATCRRDYAANGACWCGKLRDELTTDTAR